MIKLKATHIAQVTNMLLRMLTLVAKLGLTLYMGRFVSLSDVGAYGLVFGTVMTLVVVLGMRLDYVVSRDIVGVTPLEALSKMRDQTVFYLINFLVLAVVMVVLAEVHFGGVSAKIMTMIFILAIVESTANITYTNINSMGQPLLANLLFFMRSGMWAILIALAGYFIPSLRTADAIFVAWAIGGTASLIVTIFAWRHMPWLAVLKVPVNWVWIKAGMKACLFIWLGALGTTAGFYVDRFVVERSLGIEMVGVVTIYSSFTSALITLIQSGVLAFAYPRLVLFHREKNQAAFRSEAKKAGTHVALFGGVAALVVGFGLPLAGYLFNKPVFESEAPTLWLMLIGTWMKCNALTFYYVLFARHNDRAIWLGDLLYLIPAFGVNFVLVPLIGFVGIGWGTVAPNLFILLWRWWFVRSDTRFPGNAQLETLHSD